MPFKRREYLLRLFLQFRLSYELTTIRFQYAFTLYVVTPHSELQLRTASVFSRMIHFLLFIHLVLIVNFSISLVVDFSWLFDFFHHFFREKFVCAMEKHRIRQQSLQWRKFIDNRLWYIVRVHPIRFECTWKIGSLNNAAVTQNFRGGISREVRMKKLGCFRWTRRWRIELTQHY